MTSSVHYTVLIEYNWSYIHSVCLLLTFDLCMWTSRKTLLHWWSRHSVWWCPQTSCCGVKEYFPCPYVASCLPLCMSMAAVFRLHSLSDHCWARVGGDQALQCIAQGYWSVKTLGGAPDTARSVVGVVISFHSLQFSDQLLWYTHCWHCCTPSHGRWPGEGVCGTVNTVIEQ